jgi:hypothetical protein
MAAGAFPAGIFLADAIDPSTGEYRSIARGVDPVEAAAIEALRRRRGTGSAIVDDGIKIDDLDLIDDAFVSTLRSEITYAWRRLTSAHQLEIVSIAINTNNDAASVDIRIRNLSQQAGGKNRTLSLPLLTLQGNL